MRGIRTAVDVAQTRGALEAVRTAKRAEADVKRVFEDLASRHQISNSA